MLSVDLESWLAVGEGIVVGAPGGRLHLEVVGGGYLDVRGVLGASEGRLHLGVVDGGGLLDDRGVLGAPGGRLHLGVSGGGGLLDDRGVLGAPEGRLYLGVVDGGGYLDVQGVLAVDVTCVGHRVKAVNQIWVGMCREGGAGDGVAVATAQSYGSSVDLTVGKITVAGAEMQQFLARDIYWDTFERHPGDLAAND